MASRIEPEPPPQAHEFRLGFARIMPDFVARYRSLQTRVAGHPNRTGTSLERKFQEGGCSAVAALVLLAGCALERPPGVVRVTYQCDQGQGFVARYERDDQVILELADREWVLPEVSASGGARYDDGTRELRLNGRQATLRGTAATYSNCVVRDWQESEPR
jgi:membrane-bound inhibitor of C-type lysozyme